MARTAKRGLIAASRIEYGVRGEGGQVVVTVFEAGDVVTIRDGEEIKRLRQAGAVIIDDLPGEGEGE